MNKERISPGEKRLVYLLFERVIQWLNGIERDEPLELIFRKLKGNDVGFIEYDGEKFRIAINKTASGPAKILLHEVLHEIFPDANGHVIHSFELLIWNRLNEKQKEILRSFLPKKHKKKLKSPAENKSVRVFSMFFGLVKPFSSVSISLFQQQKLQQRLLK